MNSARIGSKKNKAVSELTALAREEGFEPPTNRFVAWYSIQLSYTRFEDRLLRTGYPYVNAGDSSSGGEGGIRTLGRVSPTTI